MGSKSICKVRNFLPQDYHSRDKYEYYFVEIMFRLVELQSSDEYWHSSLLDTVSYPSKESSTTGFYTYGLWWGINRGLLDKERYLDPAIKAWNTMVRAVHPSGMLGYVQSTGDKAKKVSKGKNEIYATAAFMFGGA